MPTPPEVPAQFRAVGEWKTAEPMVMLEQHAWWHYFNDARLNQLEERLGNSNQDLKAGVARLNAAQAGARVARSALFPTVSATPTVTRYGISDNSPNYARTRARINNDLLLTGNAAYEIDFFGRLQSGATVAKRQAQGSAADLATLELSLHAELATDYFLLRSLDSIQEVLDHTVGELEIALRLTHNLVEGGAVAITDQQRIEGELNVIKAQATENKAVRIQTEHAIAVLVGAIPATFSLPAATETVSIEIPVIDAGLPSDLLERRPDVAAAERRVAAANAAIGVARAAYFPIFNLNALAGYESTQRGNWTTAPSQLWAIGPTAALTLFQGGRHRAQSQQAHAAYDEQVATYRSTVLHAFQETEDHLSALELLGEEHQSQTLALRAAEGGLDQALRRYHGGIATYLEVVSSEAAVLSARLAATQLEARRLIVTVGLIKARGGGWKVPKQSSTDQVHR